MNTNSLEDSRRRRIGQGDREGKDFNEGYITKQTKTAQVRFPEQL